MSLVPSPDPGHVCFPLIDRTQGHIRCIGAGRIGITGDGSFLYDCCAMPMQPSRFAQSAIMSGTFGRARSAAAVTDDGIGVSVQVENRYRSRRLAGGEHQRSRHRADRRDQIGQLTGNAMVNMPPFENPIA